MEDGQTVGRRKFLTLLGLAPTAPFLTHITRGDIAANVGTGQGADLSGIWFNIAEYGYISSGDITTALQATIDAIGANGRCKTIMIPNVDQTDGGSLHIGSVTWPSPTNGVAWTVLIACPKITLDATWELKTGSKIIGFYTGSTGGSNGPFGPKGVLISSNNAVDPLISIPQNTTNVLLQNLWISPGNTGNSVNIQRTNSVDIRDCALSNTTGYALRMDGSFWVNCVNCKFSVTGQYAIHLTSEQPTSDVGNGLCLFKSCEFDAGSTSIIKIDSLYGPEAGPYTFEDCQSENLAANKSMFDIDSSGGVNISNINIIRCEMDDAGSPSYLLKNTGSFTNGVRILQSGNVSIDPASDLINGLKIELGQGPIRPA